MFFGCLSSRSVKSCFCSPRTAAPDLSVTCTSSVICRSEVLGGGTSGPPGRGWSWGGAVFCWDGVVLCCAEGEFCCATAASARSRTRNHRKYGPIPTHLALLSSVQPRRSCFSIPTRKPGPGVPRKQRQLRQSPCSPRIERKEGKGTSRSSLPMIIVLDKFRDRIGHVHFSFRRIWQRDHNLVGRVSIGSPVVGVLIDRSICKFLPDHNLRLIPVAKQDAPVFV